MKTKSIFTALSLSLASLTLAACGASNEGRIGRSVTGAVDGSNVNTAGATSGCGSAAGVLGRVFDDSSVGGGGSSTAFGTRVKGLISADYDPANIGQISGVNAPSATCVTLEGQLHFDSTGALVTASTGLHLKVYDSFATQIDSTGQVAGPYQVSFSSAASGHLNSDQTFQVTFMDQMGTMILSGQIVQNQVRGIIQYSNTTSVIAGTPASGTLGAFLINKTSFVN